MMFRRDSYEPIPKPKRIKDPAAIKAAATNCCELCFATFGPYCQRHIHHIRSKASGGNDTSGRVGNLISLCWLCHHKVHTGEIPRSRLLRIKSSGE